MDRVFFFALTAALYPSLLAAVTIMLTLDRPKRLLAGYLAGAWMTSTAFGLLLAFSLNDSGAADTSKHSVDPALNITLGVLLLVVVVVIGTGRDARRRAWSARRAEKSKDKPEPKWRQQLSKGSARSTFVVGTVLSFPGGSQIAGMAALSDQGLPTAVTVLCVLAFNAIMLLLCEIPTLGYVVKPEATAAAVGRFNGWLTRNGGRAALITGAVFGVLLIVRGIVNW